MRNPTEVGSTMDRVLVLNAGPSGTRFALFAATATPDCQILLRGHALAHSGGAEFLACDGAGSTLIHEQEPAVDAFHDGDRATLRILLWLGYHCAGRPVSAVGHRVAHGGTRFARPVAVDDGVLRVLDELVPLAPRHQAWNLAAIRAVQMHWPDILQVACFDTAFHHGQSWLAQVGAVPQALTGLALRRYGLHGLSYESVAWQLPATLGASAAGRVIVVHLGHCASLCALSAGSSIAATTGLAVQAGLAGGTPGDALDLFVYRIAGAIGELSAALGGLDALIFTGVIGEHSPPVRARICSACAWLGAQLDEDANAVDLELLHAPDSRLRIAIVASDEEGMLACHTATVMQDPARRDFSTV